MAVPRGRAVSTVPAVGCVSWELQWSPGARCPQGAVAKAGVWGREPLPRQDGGSAAACTPQVVPTTGR